MERLFVLKTLSRTQRATKVKKFVGFSLKPLRCRDPAPLRCTAMRTVGHFYMRISRVRACVFLVYTHDTPPRVQHFSAFHWVCLCVCLSVKQHLTYGASVRPENAVTYSAGNEGQNFCGVFSETAPLQRYGTCSLYRYPCSRPFLLRGKRACAYLTTACVVASMQQPEL